MQSDDAGVEAENACDADDDVTVSGNEATLPWTSALENE